MTLHILGIDKDPELAKPYRLKRDVSASDQFWTRAGDILIDVANVQSSIEQAVYAVIAAGGDIEVTAHNEPDRVTVTLVEPSGLRQVVFDNSRPTITHQMVA